MGYGSYWQPWLELLSAGTTLHAAACSSVGRGADSSGSCRSVGNHSRSVQCSAHQADQAVCVEHKVVLGGVLVADY